MRAMNHPEYRYQPHSPERRQAASLRERRRHQAMRRVPERCNYLGPINENDDFARCSPERQRLIMEAIHKVICVYQEPWVGSVKSREILALMLNEWTMMANIVARQAAQHLEDTARAALANPETGRG